MKLKQLCAFVLAATTALAASAQETGTLKPALTFHASFDTGLAADFSRGEKGCFVRTRQGVVTAVVNDEMKIIPGAERNQSEPDAVGVFRHAV